MEKIDLQRYSVTGPLGTGADYEARAAVDQESGRQVVLKRPVPQSISRQLHGTVEARTDRMLQLYEEVGDAIPALAPILGYTDRTNHDDYFGDSLGQEYRVIVQERARGIPLVGDARARIMRVPIGLGQNLFALHPLALPPGQPSFPIQRQLLEVEERFLERGYVLLDLMPQNVFYQPASGEVTIIDCASLLDGNTGNEGVPAHRSRPVRDMHDAFMEVLKFYITPQCPPDRVEGYRDPHSLRPVVRFEQELDEMARGFEAAGEPASGYAISTITRVRDRSYQDVSAFRNDLTAYLEAVRIRNQDLPGLPQARQAWAEALALLHGEYWRRFLFDPENDLSVFGSIC